MTPQSLVAGDRVERPLFELVRAAERYIIAEQSRTNPDNGLIAVLCDTVRLVREHCAGVEAGIPVHTGKSPWKMERP